MLKVAKEASYKSKHAAFPYQIETVLAIRNLDYAAIFHEQGLGKTKIAIDLALLWISEKVVDSVIIVTKKGLVRNWEDEISSHSHLKAKILYKDAKALFYAFNTPARLYVTHYELFKSNKRSLELFLKTRRVAVICDESHKIKNPNSAITKVLHSLAPRFARRIIMTGTPIANRPYDIWSQIWFLDQGKSLGSDYKQFRSGLDIPGHSHSALDKAHFANQLSHLIEHIGAFTVRETKASCGIELPDKQIENVVVDFEAAQFQLYSKFKSELRAEVVRDSKLVIDDAEAILKRLLRLVQVASNPRLVDSSYKGVPAKMPALNGLLNSAIQKGSKVIVWTTFTENVDWLASQLSVLGTTKVHGKMAIADRNASIAKFKQELDCKVLVATPGAAKEGLTLTNANYAIFFDRGFSLDDYLQAQDRIHRISQKVKCYVFNLLVRGSVDEWIDELLYAKHIAAQLGQGDINLDQFRNRMSYSFSEILAEILDASSTTRVGGAA